MTWHWAPLGWGIFQAVGAAVWALAAARKGRDLPSYFVLGLRSVSSAFIALAAAYALSLGPWGWGLMAFLFVGLRLGGELKPEPSSMHVWLATAALVALALARPWVPLYWDELVWLGKARFVSLGFDAEVVASLDSSLRLIPRGYPTLWPSAVGWLSCGRDAVAAQVAASAVWVALSAGVALEAWASRLKASLTLMKAGVLWALALLVTPLVWVHLRSSYVDLPLGLLGLALVGRMTASESRPLVASALALVLPGLKDEGIVYVAAAVTVSLPLLKRAELSRLLPAVAGLGGLLVWRALLHSHAVVDGDHAFDAFAWRWAPQLASLLWLHATDVFSWGLVWPMAFAVMLWPARTSEIRTLKRAALVMGLTMVAALLAGPEKVRVFAENGTLLNRLLLQLWPTFALATWFSFVPQQETLSSISV